MRPSSRLLHRCLALAAALLLSGALAAALLASQQSPGDPSRAAYEQIRIGMDREDAGAVFGDWPGRLVRGDRDSFTVAWEAPDGATIEVDFDSRGRVRGKQIAEGDQSLIGKVGRLTRYLRLD